MKYFLLGGDTPKELIVEQYFVCDGEQIIYLRPTVDFGNAVFYRNIDLELNNKKIK